MKVNEMMDMVKSINVRVVYHENGKLPSGIIWEGSKFRISKEDIFRLTHYTVNGVYADGDTLVIEAA